MAVHGADHAGIPRGVTTRRPAYRKLVAFIAPAVVGAAFVVALLCVLSLASRPADGRTFVQILFPWIQAGSLLVPAALQLDPLSSVMALVVTGVGFLIHVYSVGYMSHERAFARYFVYLNLFMFAMLTLVLANNYLLMFVGWEGVGLCSYLLIGFWYEKQSASDAGKKAFIANRIGDFGVLLAMFLVFWTFGSLSYTEVFAKVPLLRESGVLTTGLATAITLLLFLGATGKSAQIPLYVWLPDAMEGPTPVSALIHAATMVTAGVYMVGAFERPVPPGPRHDDGRGGHRRGHRDLLGHDRHLPDRHQAGPGVLHRVAARVHVPRLRRRGVHRRRSST